MDQKLFHQRIKSERASAYWFAASLWGVTGLVLGALLGVYMTSWCKPAPPTIWRDNFIAGAATDEARDTVNDRPSLLPSGSRPSRNSLFFCSERLQLVERFERLLRA